MHFFLGYSPFSHLGTSVYLLFHAVTQAPDHEAAVHEIMQTQGQ